MCECESRCRQEENLDLSEQFDPHRRVSLREIRLMEILHPIELAIQCLLDVVEFQFAEDCRLPPHFRVQVFGWFELSAVVYIGHELLSVTYFVYSHMYRLSW